jgi:hypothetical protein
LTPFVCPLLPTRASNSLLRDDGPACPVNSGVTDKGDSSEIRIIAE